MCCNSCPNDRPDQLLEIIIYPANNHKTHSKMKKINIVCILLVFAFFQTYAQVGIIDNITVEQRDDGTGFVDINYDLQSIPSALYNISLEISFDAGENYAPIDEAFLSGDLNEIGTASGLYIGWDGMASHPNVYAEESILKITAHLIGGSDPGLIVDADGNTYEFVTIGEQNWLSENLKTTSFINGDPIPTGLSNADYTNLSGPAVSIYPHGSIPGLNSDAEVLNAYGALYNGFTIIDERGICPLGWRVPTEADITQLRSFIAADIPGANMNNTGMYLKSCRQVNSPLGGGCSTTEHPRWDTYEESHGTDNYGFSLLPAGSRDDWNGFFNDVGFYAFLWTATPHATNDSQLKYVDIENDSNGIYVLSRNKKAGLAVRCVQNAK